MFMGIYTYRGLWGKLKNGTSWQKGCQPLL